MDNSPETHLFDERLPQEFQEDHRKGEAPRNLDGSAGASPSREKLLQGVFDKLASGYNGKLVRGTPGRIKSSGMRKHSGALSTYHCRYAILESLNGFRYKSWSLPIPEFVDPKDGPSVRTSIWRVGDSFQ